MRTELAVALVAGLFGLIPLMVQIVSTRAQRRDRVYRLNQLQAELEFLERLQALQGKVGATDEAAKPQTDRVISASLGKLLYQYNKLSELASSTVIGSKGPDPRQLPFLRRAFLLYYPRTNSGWVWHTLFYVIAVNIVWLSLDTVSVAVREALTGNYIAIAAIPLRWAIIFAPLSIPLLIIQRLAQRDAVRNAAQIEEPDS